MFIQHIKFSNGRYKEVTVLFKFSAQFQKTGKETCEILATETVEKAISHLEIFPCLAAFKNSKLHIQMIHTPPIHLITCW
jgi:hypothetical protein